MGNSINKELRLKTNQELEQLIAKLKNQLLQIRFNVANGEQEKMHTIKEIKKTIARALTIINERNMGVNLEINEVKKEDTK